jgi:hypothetical protein
MNSTWRTTELDPVQRMRVLREAMRAPVYAEASLPEPLDRVWSVASDLEHELPHLITTVRRFRVLESDGPQVKALAVSRIGHRAHFDVVLEPGWCLMQSRFVIGGMAAVPDGTGTRFAILGGLRGPLRRPLRPLCAVFGRLAARRMVNNLVRRVNDRGAADGARPAAAAGSDAPPPAPATPTADAGAPGRPPVPASRPPTGGQPQR